MVCNWWVVQSWGAGLCLLESVSDMDTIGLQALSMACRKSRKPLLSSGMVLCRGMAPQCCWTLASVKLIAERRAVPAESGIARRDIGLHAVLQTGLPCAAERGCGDLQEDGTMVLLDFGQCKALSAERQAALARLVVAMDQGWPAGIVRAMKVTRDLG